MVCKNSINKIISENLNFHPEYSGGLSNHLSMVCLAIYKLDGESNHTNERIIKISNDYKERLEPFVAGKPFLDLNLLTNDEINKFLGRIDFFDTWLFFFQKKLKDETNPIRFTIYWLKVLSKGIAAAGGHGFLRVYYCLVSKEILDDSIFKKELAFSLAYYASRYLNLSQSNTLKLERKKLFLSQIINDFKLEEKTVSLLKNSHLITTRHLICSWDINYSYAVSQIDLDYNLSEVLLELSKQSLIKSDFGLLHNISVGQAIIHLIKIYPELDCLDLRKGFVDFVMAEYYVRGNLKKTQIEKFFEKDYVTSLYDKVKDVHSIKSVYSLIYLYDEYNQSIFLNSSVKYMKRYN